MKTLKNILMITGSLVACYISFTNDFMGTNHLFLYISGVVVGIGIGLPSRFIRNII